jgi:HK97 family phage portal protein
LYFKIEFGKPRQEAEELRRTVIEDPGIPVTAKNIIDVFGITSSRSGVDVDQETAVTFSAVWACVRILSEAMASLPLNVHIQEGRNKRIYFEHPAQRILHDEPCEMYTSFYWRELMMQSLLLWGNAYSKIIRDKKTYKPLWLDYIHPGIVQPYQAIRSNGTKTLKYKVMVTGGEEIIDSENMIHVAGLGFDGIQGKSPIEVAADAVGLGIAAERFNSEFFNNGASFNGILSTEQAVKKEQLDMVAESWKKRYTGAGKRWMTPVLPFGFKYSPVGIAPEAAQLVATRKFQVEEISRIYGVPLHMISDLSKSSFSNIEQQSIEYVMHTLRPYCVRFEQEYNRKLLQEAEKGNVYTKYNLEGLLRGDSAARAAYYNTTVTLGILTRNEVRELEDRNPIEGLDEPLTPLNLQDNSADSLQDATPKGIDNNDKSNDDEKV